jgi:hypothetical protein
MQGTLQVETLICGVSEVVRDTLLTADCCQWAPCEVLAADPDFRVRVDRTFVPVLSRPCIPDDVTLYGSLTVGSV